ncbi:hypothetical protein Tco_0780443 [Tanacetum coccineum]
MNSIDDNQCIGDLHPILFVRRSTKLYNKMRTDDGGSDVVIDLTGGEANVVVPDISFKQTELTKILSLRLRLCMVESVIPRLCGLKVGEGQLIGPELVQETTEKISQIKDRLKAARDRVVRFGKKGKLAPRFVGPFKIIEKVGPVAYMLDLPEELDGDHDTFHVSNLKKCLANPTLQVPLDEIQVDAKLNFVEEPVEILEREFKKLKRSRIVIVKVQWNSKCGPKFTWEREDQMKLKDPHLFSNVSS